VEHFAATGKRAHLLAVLALVEEEAGLLPPLDVDLEVETVLDDRAARGGAVAAHEAGARLEAFELARLGIRALVDRRAAGDLNDRLEGPDARPDLRVGTVGGAGERLAVRVAHLDGIAALRLAAHALHRAGKDPRMAALERLLAPGLQQQLHHFLRARGCAAS